MNNSAITIEEINSVDSNIEIPLFEFSRKNMAYLIKETLRLREARIKDQELIIKRNEELIIHKEQIIGLIKQYGHSTPLMVVTYQDKYINTNISNQLPNDK